MDFFYENKGVCPECGSKLILSQPACVNWDCKICKKERKRNPEFDMRIANRKKNLGVEILISDCYHEQI